MSTLVIVGFALGGFSLGFLAGILFLRIAFVGGARKYKNILAALRVQHDTDLKRRASQAIENDQRHLAHLRKEVYKLAQEEQLIFAEMPTENELN